MEPFESQRRSLGDTSTAYQVNDKDHHRNHQQQVNQATCDVKAKAEKPQNE
jgi:hypothetical protein